MNRKTHINQSFPLILWPLLVIIRYSKEDRSSIQQMDLEQQCTIWFWFDENRKRWCTASQLNLIWKKKPSINQEYFSKCVLNISLPGHKRLAFWKTQEIFYKLKIASLSTRRYTYPSCHFDSNGWHDKEIIYKGFIREALCKFSLGSFFKIQFCL